MKKNKKKAFADPVCIEKLGLLLLLPEVHLPLWGASYGLGPTPSAPLADTWGPIRAS